VALELQVRQLEQKLRDSENSASRLARDLQVAQRLQMRELQVAAAQRLRPASEPVRMAGRRAGALALVIPECHPSEEASNNKKKNPWLTGSVGFYFFPINAPSLG
jgi:hypothetical protein